MSKKYQLPNGLTVILNESHKSPVVSVQMWVRTGSADEKKGEEGISHFIEHLVFKGTDKFKVGEIASTVEGSGGELNAYTSFDQTVFYVTISKQFTDVALEVISEMMGFPTFDPEEIDNEREVVIEEIKRGQDSFGRQASQLLFSESYRGHPYSVPVIGYEKNIRKLSPKKIKSFFQSRYVPSNMFLVVSGDFEGKEMKSKVKDYFGKFEPYKLKKVKRDKGKVQEKPNLKVKLAPFEDTSVYVSWKIPKVQHKDIPALDILALVLGQGESSRLIQKMRIEKPLVNSVYASAFTPQEKGLFVCAATFNQERIEEVLQTMKDEIAKILQNPISAEELAKSITNIESEEFYGMETVDGLSRKSGHLEFLMNDPKYFPKYMKQVYSVTVEDVQKVARKYLKMKNLTMTLLAPEKSDEKELKKHCRKWIKEFEKVVATPKSKENKKEKPIKRKKISFKKSFGKKSEVEKIDLGQGSHLYLLPSYETPTLSVKVAHLGGLRLEDENLGGVTEVLSRVWTAGTKELSEKEIQLKLENSASQMGAFGGRNTVGLSLETLSSFEKDMSEVFSDVFLNPTWSQEIIDREVHVMKERLRARDDNPAQKTIQKFYELLFADHPYHRDLYGSKESLGRIQSSDVSTHWQKMSSQNNLVAVASGFIDRDLWVDLFKKMAQQTQSHDFKNATFSHKNPEKAIQYFEKMDKEQSHIVTGVKGLTFTDKDRYTLELIQSILSGQGGRLFIELRDKASLAYTVSPLRMEGIDTGYFGAYIGCSPEKGQKAISMLKEEFQKLMSEAVPEDELERSKRYLIGRHDIDLQRNSSVGSGILFSEIYGIPHQEIFNYADHVSSVSAGDIQDLASRLFSQEFVTVAMGSEEPF